MKIAFCKVPKAALTSLLEISLILNNFHHPAHFNRSQNQNWIQMMYPKILAKSIPLESFYFNIRSYGKYQNFTTLLLTRHPFERLLSAYIDKIKNSDGIKFRSLIHNCYLRKTQLNISYSNEISFSIFVNSILSNRCREPHWNPVVDMCLPCQIRYDYIFKTEFFHQDIGCLLKTIDERIRPAIQAYHVHNSKHWLHFYYSQLTSSQIEGLWRYYYLDHVLFGYRFIDYRTNSNTAMWISQDHIYGNKCVEHKKQVRKNTPGSTLNENSLQQVTTKGVGNVS